MASIPARIARRIPIMRVLALAEAVVATRKHWAGIDPVTRTRLRELVAKSRGRPSNLTANEKRELRSLVGRLDLMKLGRELAGRRRKQR